MHYNVYVNDCGQVYNLACVIRGKVQPNPCKRRMMLDDDV